MTNSVLVTLLVFTLATLTSSSRGHGRGHDGGHGVHDGGVVLRGSSRLGERDVWVRLSGVHALEETTPGRGERGMYFRQATDGRHFVQTVYQGRNNLIDCDVTKDAADVSAFLQRFRVKENEARRRASGGNVTATAIADRRELAPEEADLLDLTTMRAACKTLHRRMRKQLKRKQRMAVVKANSVQAFNRLSGQEVTSVDNADFRSRKPHKTATSGRSSTSSGSGRVKRGYIYPGTNWCGSGDRATDFDDLGDNVGTDKCCRGHDHCPYTIEGFSRRYNLFNYRFHTLSHCQCDEIFRTCLRSAANSVADMVGQVYFNVVGMKCFTLKKIETCARRSWWGRCVEYKDDYEAEVNEPFEY